MYITVRCKDNTERLMRRFKPAEAWRSALPWCPRTGKRSWYCRATVSLATSRLPRGQAWGAASDHRRLSRTSNPGRYCFRAGRNACQETCLQETGSHLGYVLGATLKWLRRPVSEMWWLCSRSAWTRCSPWTGAEMWTRPLRHSYAC